MPAEVKVNRCQCDNPIPADEDMCDWCAYAESQPPHKGHRAPFTGTWWCDTCNSPLCDLL